MDIGTALVFTVGGIIGSILVTQMWQLNYFKRENFKFSMQQEKRKSNINFKKLEKDLGLKAAPKAAINPGTIASLADAFIGGENEEEGIMDNPVISGIINYASSHPELTQKVLSQAGITKNNEEKDETHYES